MFDSLRFIKITTTRKHGTVITCVVPTWIAIKMSTQTGFLTKLSYFFANTVRFLNKKMSFFLRYYYVIVTGLGLGIGLSIGAIVVQFPSSIQANPIMNEDNSLAVMPSLFGSQQLTTLPVSQNFQWIASNQLFVQVGSDLHTVDPIFLYSGIANKFTWSSKNLELGSLFQVVGENNGVYEFGIVGFRELALDELFQTDVWFGLDVDLVFYIPDTSNPGYFRVVLAKRV